VGGGIAAPGRRSDCGASPSRCSEASAGARPPAVPDHLGAFTVFPPGQEGNVTAAELASSDFGPHYDDQVELYASLPDDHDVTNAASRTSMPIRWTPRASPSATSPPRTACGRWTCSAMRPEERWRSSWAPVRMTRSCDGHGGGVRRPDPVAEPGHPQPRSRSAFGRQLTPVSRRTGRARALPTPASRCRAPGSR
jgi:hypothetical protein